MRALIKKLIAANALISGSAAFDPFTVTDLSPEQSSAIQSAEASILAAITAQPEFTSIVLELVTDAKAFSALTAFLAQPLQPGTAGEADLNSLINEMPSEAGSFFRSLTAQEGLIVSSILNANSAPVETTLVSVSVTTTLDTTSSTILVQPPQTSSMSTGSKPTSVTVLASATSTTQVSVETSGLPAATTTLLATTPSTYASTSTSVAIVSENVGAFTRGGGLRLALAILAVGIGIAVF